MIKAFDLSSQNRFAFALCTQDASGLNKCDLAPGRQDEDRDIHEWYPARVRPWVRAHAGMRDNNHFLMTGPDPRLFVRLLLPMAGDVNSNPRPNICSGCSKTIRRDINSCRLHELPPPIPPTVHWHQPMLPKATRMFPLPLLPRHRHMCNNTAQDDIGGASTIPTLCCLPCNDPTRS